MSRGQCERGRAEHGDGEKWLSSCAHYRIGNPGLTLLLCILDNGQHKVQNDQFSHWCFQPQEGHTQLATSSPLALSDRDTELCPVETLLTVLLSPAPSLPIKTCSFF